MNDNITISRKLLESFVDEENCSFDHNHSCQAHGYFYLEQGEKCPQFELKELLAKAAPKENNQ